MTLKTDCDIEKGKTGPYLLAPGSTKNAGTKSTSTTVSSTKSNTCNTMYFRLLTDMKSSAVGSLVQNGKKSHGKYRSLVNRVRASWRKRRKGLLREAMASAGSIWVGMQRIAYPWVRFPKSRCSEFCSQGKALRLKNTFYFTSNSNDSKWTS